MKSHRRYPCGPAARQVGLPALPPMCRIVRPTAGCHRLYCGPTAALPVAPAGRAAQPTPPSAVPQSAAAEATHEVDHVKLVKEELAEHRKVVVAQVAPAVRVTIGEELGLPIGTSATGKLVSALRDCLGFDYVFDVLAGADVTIMEEGTELMNRLRGRLSGSPDAPPLPMFTSCCPGWIAFVENCSPDLIPYLSTAKSPHMMSGALIKSYFSGMLGRRAEELSVVSIMPCVRKQAEADRIWFQLESGAREVDHVLTTRDVGALLRDRGVDFMSLSDAPFDAFMGVGSGAAALFGTTGGVMEAALRTVVELAGGQPMLTLEYTAVRGLAGVKEATATIPAHPGGPLGNAEPVTLRVAVANGLGNAKKLLDAVRDGTTPYHFVEVMACPGGCIGGGGQPRSKEKDTLMKRQAALYSEDERSVVRRSFENPVVKQIYAQHLQGEPCSAKAKELLHTRYVECGPPKFDIMAQPTPEEGPACPLPEAEVCDVEVCCAELSSGGSDGEAAAAAAAIPAGEDVTCCRFNVP